MRSNILEGYVQRVQWLKKAMRAETMERARIGECDKRYNNTGYNKEKEGGELKRKRRR